MRFDAFFQGLLQNQSLHPSHWKNYIKGLCLPVSHVKQLSQYILLATVADKLVYKCRQKKRNFWKNMKKGQTLDFALYPNCMVVSNLMLTHWQIFCWATLTLKGTVQQEGSGWSRSSSMSDERRFSEKSVRPPFCERWEPFKDSATIVQWLAITISILISETHNQRCTTLFHLSKLLTLFCLWQRSYELSSPLLVIGFQIANQKQEGTLKL